MQLSQWHWLWYSAALLGLALAFLFAVPVVQGLRRSARADRSEGGRDFGIGHWIFSIIALAVFVIVLCVAKKVGMVAYALTSALTVFGTLRCVSGNRRIRRTTLETERLQARLAEAVRQAVEHEGLMLKRRVQAKGRPLSEEAEAAYEDERAVLSRVIAALRENLGRLRGREMRGQNIVRRLLDGNPTMTEISITQLSLWVSLVMVSWLLACVVNHHWFAAIGVLVLVGALTRYGWKEAPNRPPHRGCLTVFAKRTEVEMDEGWIFLCPFVEGVILVNVEKREHEVVIQDIRTKDNVPFDMKVTTAYTPDQHRLRRYLQVGDKNITGLLESLVEQCVRIFFYEVPDWSVVQGRIKPENVESDGVAQRDTVVQEPFEAALGIRKKLIDKLFVDMTEAENGADDLRPRVKEGLEDNQAWGIRILGIYIGPIVMTGPIAEEADKTAREVAQRRAEIFEKETEGLAAQMVRRLMPSISEERAFQIVLDYKAIAAGNGSVTRLDVPTDVVVALASLLGRR